MSSLRSLHLAHPTMDTLLMRIIFSREGLEVCISLLPPRFSPTLGAGTNIHSLYTGGGDWGAKTVPSVFSRRVYGERASELITGVNMYLGGARWCCTCVSSAGRHVVYFHHDPPIPVDMGIQKINVPPFQG